jgi:hypothetical protein
MQFRAQLLTLSPDGIITECTVWNVQFDNVSKGKKIHGLVRKNDELTFFAIMKMETTEQSRQRITTEKQIIFKRGQKGLFFSYRKKKYL